MVYAPDHDVDPHQKHQGLFKVQDNSPMRCLKLAASFNFKGFTFPLYVEPLSEIRRRL